MQGIDLQRKGKELAAELDYYVKSHFEQLVEQFVVWMRMMRIGFWITWNVVTVIMWENFILI